MKLARFTENGSTRIGKIVNDHVIDLSAIRGVGSSMRQLLADLSDLRPALEASQEPRFALSSVRLEAPLPDAQKYLAIGMNYTAHCKEAADAGYPIPSSQFWFNKQVSSITGPYDPIEMPKVSDQLDYEVELGVVIGKRCRHVSTADARAVIAGYVACNDVSVRDWQARSPTFTLGKSFDTHGPLGPWITTDDEIEDPHALQMSLAVNGEIRQHAQSDDMVYSIYEQIAYLSTVMTLEPGDILSTGTPSGVGIASGRLLKLGDVVRIEIEHLGVMENTVVAEV